MDQQGLRRSWERAGPIVGGHDSDRRATSEPGRVCAEPDCPTKLSIYNKTEHCSRHARFGPAHEMGRRPGDQVTP